MIGSDVFATEVGQRRRAAKLHWPSRTHDGRAACSGVPLALFGEIAATTPGGRRCRANGCWQRWFEAGLDPEPDQ